MLPLPDRSRGRHHVGAVLLLACLATGCSTEHHARTLVERDTGWGKMRLAGYASSDEMIRRGEIDDARRVLTDDGIEIDVWILSSRKTDLPSDQTMVAPRSICHGTVVLLHGLTDSKVAYLALGRKLAEAGFDVVLPDLRAHGRSGGQFVTWGAAERQDIKRVLDVLLAEKRIATPVLAFGASMGASVAIGLAAVDPRCRGVLAVAPFKDGPTITRRSLWWMSEEQFAETWKTAGEIAHFNPRDTSAIDAIRHVRVPVVVVHGLLDSIVPHHHGKEIAAAGGGPRKFVSVSWANHATVLLGREDWFVQRLLALSRGKLEPPSE